MEAHFIDVIIGSVQALGKEGSRSRGKSLGTDVATPEAALWTPVIQRECSVLTWSTILSRTDVVVKERHMKLINDIHVSIPLASCWTCLAGDRNNLRLLSSCVALQVLVFTRLHIISIYYHFVFVAGFLDGAKH